MGLGQVWVEFRLGSGQVRVRFGLSSGWVQAFFLGLGQWGYEKVGFLPRVSGFLYKSNQNLYQIGIRVSLFKFWSG